jgi:hypothetical protein
MGFSAKDILRFTGPGELFSDRPDRIKDEYARLAKQWHPDNHGNSGESNEVMVKINLLYQQGLELIRVGRWEKPGWLRLRSKDGKRHEINYYRTVSFELGTAYIGNHVVFYLVDSGNRDFYQNAVKSIAGLKYANEKMETEIRKYLPKVIAEFETSDRCWGVVIGKTPDFILLQDLLAYFDNRMEERHMAWIVSSLLNIACYLDYAGLSHNSISLDTYFVSPEQHSGALLGGWWYATPRGCRMPGVPEKIFAIMPPQVKTEKKGNILTDLESIRLIGRELAGDRNGTRLEGNLAGPLVEWLRGASSESAFAEYSRWGEVLKAAFGARRFVKLDVTAPQVYDKIKKRSSSLNSERGC